METFHRLAGVQDASDYTSAQPVQLISSHDPDTREASTRHDQDIETGTISSQPNRASRASLPLNRQPSRKSLRDQRRGSAVATDVPPTPRLHGFNSHQAPQVSIPRTSLDTGPSDEGTANVDDEDFAWGPSHPCFPHPNPHCLPTSSEFAQTRVIRVRRDWLVAGDLYPQYANLYPEILDPLVSDAEFRFLISNINTLLKRAFSPYMARAWVDSLLGLVTGYLWEDLGLTGAKLGAKKVERFIDRWNDERRTEGRDVKVIHLSTTGFMNIDFIIPDPGIDATVDEREEEHGGVNPVQR